MPQMKNTITVRCAVCKKEFEVSAAQYKLMTGIGKITCGPKCAAEWIQKN